MMFLRNRRFFAVDCEKSAKTLIPAFAGTASAAFSSSFVTATYAHVRLIPQDFGGLASGHFCKALQEIMIEDRGKTLMIRSECLGTCGKIFQAVGVAIPPTIREVA
jgi:hypothetical protein